jgi:RNA polymerase sigma-70 factor (ECF subfamily)
VETLSFADLLRQVRAGDETAAAIMVKQYEPHIRRVVRSRLTDPRLRRQMDSVDICQSVLGDFFVRVAVGQFELSSPEQLVKLLAVLARNRVVEAARTHHAARRDVRREHAEDVAELQIDARQPGPDQLAEARELLQKFRDRLKTTELEIAAARAQERSWADIGAALGHSPDALRMRWNRTINRIARELGLVDTHA